MNVIKIPAKPQKGNNAAKEQVKKLRVAAYCRVSTDNEEQATSYETQIEHYTEFINKNPEWELVKVYADDGISATSTKGREQFNAMIEDCKKGLIDMIFTKSISRFARNTVDCLNYIRMLKEMNIPVFFEKESRLEGRSPPDHYGIAGTAGIGITQPERQDRCAVPLPAGEGDGQCPPLSRL